MNVTRWTDRILVVCALVAFGVVVRQLQATQGRWERVTASADSLRRIVRLTEIQRSVANEVLLRQDLPATFPGTDSIAARLGASGRPMLVYWMSPNCPTCAMNYDVLRELSHRFPGQIVALSPDGTKSVDSVYASMAIPAFDAARQDVAGVLPGSTFPVALVLQGRSRLRYIVGKIHRDSTAALLERSGPIAGALR